MRPKFICYEGEGNQNEQTFTQDQVNTFLAEEKRKHQKTQQALATELEGLKKNASLTAEEKKVLEKRIEELQNQYMTAEEKARHASEKVQKQTTEQLEALTKERDTWQRLHSQLLIDTQIIKSATENKAYYSEQIAALLRPVTKLVENLDEEGKPNGEYTPKVMFADKDKNDKPIILELTIPEAVKRMTELDQFGNLFEGSKKGGVGGSGNVSAQKIDIAKIARENPVEYRKLRKERPELFV